MDASLVGTQFGSTLLAVGGIQWLKNSSWFPLIKEGQKIGNRIWSIVAAGAITLGIHYVWNPAPDGSHILTITIPTASVLFIAFFHWASQFIFQETGYTLLQGMQSLTTLARSIQTMPTDSQPAHPATAAVAITSTEEVIGRK
jgi:MFS superfamily sulfate permease-like transporter